MNDSLVVPPGRLIASPPRGHVSPTDHAAAPVTRADVRLILTCHRVGEKPGSIP
jgi:hypothetical protein